MQSRIMDLLLFYPLFLFSLSFHEAAHGYVAEKLGDNTARLMGRVTLNPLPHMDIIGTVFLPIMGILTGAPVIGWGKPVPFNPHNLRNKKWGPSLVALAGPASNFLIALIVGLALRFLTLTDSYLIIFLGYFVWINLLLGIFNLMPIPPLDGSHLFAVIFPALEDMKRSLQGNMIFIIGVIFFMIYIGIPYIVRPLFVLITGIPSLF